MQSTNDSSKMGPAAKNTAENIAEAVRIYGPEEAEFDLALEGDMIIDEIHDMDPADLGGMVLSAMANIPLHEIGEETVKSVDRRRAYLNVTSRTVLETAAWLALRPRLSYLYPQLILYVANKNSWDKATTSRILSDFGAAQNGLLASAVPN